MERKNRSDLEIVADVMDRRYPKFDNEVELRKYLEGDFENFSFLPSELKVAKLAIGAVLDETLKSPQRIINSEETSYKAIYRLSKELEGNPKNVVAGFLLASVDEEEVSQFSVRTRKPVQIEVGRTMPYLWPLDLRLYELRQNDLDLYRRTVSKKLRDAVRKQGIGFGVLSGCYMGMGADDVLKLFEDINFKKELEGMGSRKIPSKSRGGDRSAIIEIKKRLEEGTEKGYKESLKMLSEQDWMPNDPIIRNLHYGIQQVSETVFPCVHLMTASEAAVNAGRDIFNPYDLKMITTHLQKEYYPFVTSEVRSAHLTPTKPYPKW